MSILIKRLFGKDMPMPQEGFVDIRIHFKSGKLRYVTMPTGEDPFYATFEVEKLPPHGRLIDADELIRELASEHVGGLEAIKKYTNADTWTSGLHTAWRLIDDASTVIEAEGET